MKPRSSKNLENDLWESGTVNLVALLSVAIKG